ncbi:MAG: sigma factor-like helix-turn-helix DNA-binding protein [Eubacteriales bacterium]|jgi:RNA polymerase sigma-70 factor (ECF subfamily)
MISDTEWAIDLMETGRIPGSKWSVARWSREKREVLCDPLEMARYVQNREPISAAPEWMVKLLEKLMRNLTEREKQAYELVRGRGYSFGQAAKLMECNKGSVQNFVQRAERKISLVVRLQTIYRGTFCG